MVQQLHYSVTLSCCSATGSPRSKAYPIYTCMTASQNKLCWYCHYLGIMNGLFEDLSHWKMADLFTVTAMDDDTIAFCHHFGFLSQVKVCVCGRNMLLQNWNGNIDGRHWHCNGQDCRHAERLRSGIIFSGLHLLLQQLVCLVYLYSIGFTKQLT